MPGEEILLVNPRRRKRRAKGKRKSAMGYTVGSRKIRRRKLNPRHRRRNPRFSLRGVTGLVLPAATGAAGALALDVALAYIPVPDTFRTGWMGTATKAAGAIGLGMLAGKFLSRRTGALFTAGALTIIAYQAIRNLIPAEVKTKVKGLGGVADFVDYQPAEMGAYMRPSLAGSTGMDVAPGYYSPAGVLAGDDGMGAYMTDMGM